MKKEILIMFVLMLFISGCQIKNHNLTQEERIKEQKIKEDARLFQLFIDEKGNLLHPSSEEIVENETLYINNIIENFKKKKKENKNLKLVIFIHGGLNNYESANARVDNIKDSIEDDNKYPIFISWNSEFKTNYSDHLFQLRRGIKAKKHIISSPVVLIEDLLRSIIRLPISTYNLLFNQSKIMIKVYDEEEKASDKALEILVKEDQFKLQNSRYDRGLKLKDWTTVLNPIKLITAPAVDVFGTGSWNSMLRRTDLILKKDSTPNGDDNDKTSDTAVTLFLDEFNVKFPKHEIDLIGHSMGTIISNNIISKYPDMNFKNIVYMAAACKIKDLEAIVYPYMFRNSDTSFYNLTLNPYRDLSENAFYDFVPRGSLLVWIDQTLGDINSFTDRTAGFWFNIIRAANKTFKDPKVRKKVYLTQFGMRDIDPKKHGDFSKKRFKFWNEDFWKGKIKK